MVVKKEGETCTTTVLMQHMGTILESTYLLQYIKILDSYIHTGWENGRNHRIREQRKRKLDMMVCDCAEVPFRDRLSVSER